jgi:putative PIN family toxin of toxin-antitoxin system
MQIDRVVLDTNFFISIILNGNLAQLSRLIIENNIEVYICDELLNEIAAVLSRKKFKKVYSKIEIKNNIEFIQLIAEKIIIDQRFDRAPDIKDNYLFDLCYSVKSYYLVTGDKPLQNLKHVGKIQIISPTKFYKLVKQYSTNF